MLHPAAWLTVITVGVYILGVLAAINAIMKAHTSQGAIAWAIALLTFPYLALPLYVLFGSSRFHGYVNARRRGNSEIHQFSSDLANKVGDVLTSLPAEIGSFKVLEHLAGMPFTSGNDAKLLINGEAAFTEFWPP